MLKIATVLPYKENYTSKDAGAVSLWVKDFYKYKKENIKNTIYGNTRYKKYLTKNYKNVYISSLNSKLFSSTIEYSKNLIKIFNKSKYDIIEVHNRPNVFLNLIKKVNSKYILYLHNDPRSMKGSKTIKERLEILKKVDKIIFISKWVKKKFFENLNHNDDSKCEIIYHSIEPELKRPPKIKRIVFIGKLNESKGYDLYCEAVKYILSKYHDWKAYSIGDERRQKIYSEHKNHFNLGYVPHKKVLAFLNKTEIAIVPSRWEEPFGRTALEASSRGCATIISNKGGLPETTNSAIILKNLSKNELIKKIDYLIKNKKKRNDIQKKSYKNVKHNLKSNSAYIDKVRLSLFPFLNITKKTNYRIMNIYNMGQKLNHRLYHISLGRKITNGLIRLGHDVLEISDRDYVKRNRVLNLLSTQNKFNEYLINTFKIYKPDFLFFGHSDHINIDTIKEFRRLNSNIIISQWNEDPLMTSIKDTFLNINKIYKYKNYVDNTFVTSNIDVLKSRKLDTSNIHYLFIPVDRNIECFDVYNLNPENDVFYAMSHGVNRATLKRGKKDEREIFLNKLIRKLDNIKYDFYGFNGKEPIWGENFFTALINSKMGLNLSRGLPTKHYSSNRIATLMGNGLLTFIDKRTFFNDIFNKNELVFYNELDDLKEKINYYKNNPKIRKFIAKNGQRKYFNLFNEKNISQYILDKSLGKKRYLI